MSSVVEGYNYDIFISYRQKDNKGDRWVSEFVEALKTELESTFKEEISVYFDINPHDGLLETHDVDASLKDKLKCLVFIPIISRTYCDPKSFAWQHEFVAFVEQASKDSLGLKVNLPHGNVANRVLPVKIHELDPTDVKLCETVLGGVPRGVDFIFKSSGVNRPLRITEDNPKDNLNHTFYRDQINKVANALKEIIDSLRQANDSLDQGTIKAKEKPETISEKRIYKKIPAKDLIKKLWLPLVLVLLTISTVIYFTKEKYSLSQKTIALMPLSIYGDDDDLKRDASNFIEAANDKLHNLRQVSLTSTFANLQYSKTDKPLNLIFRELDADYILYGNIKLEGEKTAIWVELSTRNNKSLWTKKYIWDKDKIQLITKDLIANIADHINLKLTSEELALIDQDLTKNADANLSYISANAITNDATFFLQYGNKLRDSVSYMAAIRSYDKAIKSDPGFAEAYAKRSIAISWGIYSGQVDSSYIDEAKTDAEKSITLKNSLPEGQIALGFYYYYCLRDGSKKALEHFRMASEMVPGDYHPIYYMSLVYRMTGEWDKSMALTREVIKHNPSEALFLTNIGTSYQQIHSYDSALIFHQKAIDIMPKWSAAYLNKLTTLIQRDGTSDEAWKLLDEVIKKTGENVSYYRLSLYMLEAKYDEALAESDSLPAGTADTYLCKAAVYSALNNFIASKTYSDSALKQLRKYIDFCPKCSYIRMKIAMCYDNMGDKKKAIDEAEAALRSSVNNSMVMSDLKVAYLQILIDAARYDDALKMVEDLLANPSSLSVKLMLSDPVYKPLRDKDKFKLIVRKYKTD